MKEVALSADMCTFGLVGRRSGRLTSRRENNSATEKTCQKE